MQRLQYGLLSAGGFAGQPIVNLLSVLIVIAAVGAVAFIAGRRRMLTAVSQGLSSIDPEQNLEETEGEVAAVPGKRELRPILQRVNAAQEHLKRRYESRLVELDRERSKTEAIIESVEDGLIVLDRNDAVVHINEVACAILDLDAQQIESRALHELAPHNVHIRKLLGARNQQEDGTGNLDNNTVEFKLFLRGRDHSYLSRDLPWMGPDGERLGTIVLLQDVTFVRDQERNRTNLVATLSHELKTPLTSLAIGAELLAESAIGEKDQRRLEILATIQQDVSRLNALASGLLDASRSSIARIGVERCAILLDKVVREACRPLAIQAREKRIEFEVIADSGPLPIWGDPIKLPWVVTNLVGNALRYTPSGGRIVLELRREANIARTIVTDTGSGIAPDVLPKIFEPFAQFPDDPAQVGSAGLGLYIAKEIVEAHNGRIFANSANGRGTTFTVDIPMREEAIG